MEKWKTKGKRSTKEESVLPPTRRTEGQNCLSTMEKKKDRKWSFGGLLRRISSGQNNEGSSNDEDITYIPGHMLSKKNTKKTSKMRSKIGKISNRISESPISSRSEKFVVATPESTRSFEIGERSQDSLAVCSNDSTNLRSSDGSLDAAIRASRINRTKARAQAKRDRLCGNSSSDDDSHKSNQSLMRFRSDENMEYIQKIDSTSRKTRGARTERYIKRMYRDDCGSGSDSKIIKPVALPRTIEPSSLRYSSNSIDKSSSAISHVQIDRNLSKDIESRYLRDMNENETYEREKRALQDNRKSAAINEIYGSLRSSRESIEYTKQKLVPPEPPPRSSISKIFRNAYIPSTSELTRDSREISNCGSSSQFHWQNPDMWKIPEKSKASSLNEKDENIDILKNREFYSRNDNCNSLDRGGRFNVNSTFRLGREQENYDPRPHFVNAIPPKNYDRSTFSLPKSVQLFSRQKLSDAPKLEKNCEIPKLRKCQGCQNSLIFLKDKSMENEDAERKRSSKNLEEALSELEAIYNSLRLSDDDLLERAEERSMEEYRDKAAKKAAEHSLKNFSDTSSNEKEEYSSQRENEIRMKDDMAYRRMNPKERPSSVNGRVSLSNISYLATSPNLSLRENDCIDWRNGGRRGTPDLTRDDLLFRSMSHANNTLRVIEPQPPFGIPLGPVTAATESDYLHVKPTKFGQTRSLYIPKSEPDVVSDDLAFRNLRKDSTRDNFMEFNNKNTNLFLQNDTSHESSLPMKNSFVFGAKKRAVRSMSADLYGIVNKEVDKRNNDWYNDYIKSTQKLRFYSDASGIDEENSNDNIDVGITTKFNCDEFSPTIRSGNESNLDINGNRPKSALHKKIQVFVPQGTSYDEALAKHLSENHENIEKKSNNLTKFINKESDDSNKKIEKNIKDSIKFVDTESEDSLNEKRPKASMNSEEIMKNVETEDSSSSASILEQEISEYLRLCIDLEKLLQQTAEREDAIVAKTEENNSQSEFDELEKLLIDYDHENIGETSTEKEDDRSSSRSIDQSGQSQFSDNTQSSPIRTIGKFDDDTTSSTSELGNSSNAGSSLNENVYDKFNQLLREVNDVPFVKPKNILYKCPIDEKINIDDSKEILQETKVDRNIDLEIDKKTKNFIDEETLMKITQETNEAIDSNTNHLYKEEIATQDDSFDRGNVKIKNRGRRESFKEDEVKSSFREGEKLYEKNEINEDAIYAFNDYKMHPIRKFCYVTNSITAYHVIVCSLFLTLLITIIVAQ